MTIEAVELVVTALAAGAAAGAKDTATTAVKDAYAGLKSGVRRLLGRDELPDDPEELAAELTEANVGDDAEVLEAARAVLRETEPHGKYHVTVTDSKGVQIGDGNTMNVG
ncbi:RIP homotypic interaction motif-containing protein [Amycolatopsis sp. NPDC005003]